MSANRSFHHNGGKSVTLANGQIAHADHVEHSQRLVKKFYALRPGVWCFVGNGLSNQTFIEGPDGVVAIDSGECVQEMRAAIQELRKHTAKPIAAVLYTHFHYIAGTTAVLEDNNGKPVPIYGHYKIDFNRARASTEIGPSYGRGLLHQFGTQLPEDGPDGIVNVGLGMRWRNAEHAPYTPGYAKPTNTFDDDCTFAVAGLQVEVKLAPSDADDSVTYWFPELRVAVHNIVWPALFNIFAIRGEEYRDPRRLLKGVADILQMRPEYLLGAHGAPLQGEEEIQTRVTRYHDSIAFLWDQSVRSINAGATSNDLASKIQLPSLYQEDSLTSEFYGVAEHHVRQIRSGLFGFFDDDEANLFPLPTADRANRMIDGFGGRAVVREKVQKALEANDPRWAIEMASWLYRSAHCTAEDRGLLASALRMVAQRTSSANIRNWCLTRARTLDGSLSVSRHYKHAMRKNDVIAAPLARYVHLLRVMVDPAKAAGVDTHFAIRCGDEVAGLHIRNYVAVPTNGSCASVTLVCLKDAWADLVGGKLSLQSLIGNGSATIVGDRLSLERAFGCFDINIGLPTSSL